MPTFGFRIRVAVRVLTPREQLDRVLSRFVDHVLGGEDDQALTAFADAQALMVDMQAAHDEAVGWVTAEQLVAAALPADVEDRSEAQQRVLWGHARGRGGRR